MKKKRSIQKLRAHKQTISTLNMIVAGDGIGVVRTSMGGLKFTRQVSCLSCPCGVSPNGDP
ncbi:hypothetical protein [uncultured Kordia sp.]|uniref:hypothetical protein n=1 Tax=uncultured Kordia sp. TaxID=507699 RepID=UPI002619F676|nr:hypothetical protein [uncultured Kordia sp.]